MTPVRIALSNDYDVVLHGLATMLEPYRDRVEVLTATASVQMPPEVDVILFDTFGRLPDGDDKLRRIVAENDAAVVVFSWDSYPEHLARRHGAAAYLHKGIGAEDLVDAVVAIHEGRDVVAGTPAVDDGGMPAWPGQEHGLTARESEVLTFVAQGLSNDEIAQRSYLSINTVKTYLRTAYRKIGATRRSQAVLWAVQHGFSPETQQE
ncbi:response regulator transcription factor [Nocardioides sp. SYSU D00038]|uniref:response regulator transcription factor n=1 Tax=Nocardioides sp. SYSU D00038 TaxID=2812554 RepID=UPI001967AD22|nr:response regulator transcription factor [Nocardioides sp. SYSU D00038]